MQIDKTTYEDLSLFNHADEFSIFEKLNLTRTLVGKQWLQRNFNNPFSSLHQIQQTQQMLRVILEHENDWPVTITNGTIMVMERYYETAIDDMPAGGNIVNAMSYKLLHGPDYSMTRYSVGHFADFIRGMYAMLPWLEKDNCPEILRTLLERVRFLINHELIRQLGATKKEIKFTVSEVVSYGHHIRTRFKNFAIELIDIYGRMDAWYGMAMATKKFNLVFPDFIEGATPDLDAKDLYHILLPTPVAYNVQLHKQTNFFFLTGANMAGKSTFIKAVGTAVFLAHLGMGVPAKSMRLTLFDGILSNINVVDNIIKGESYFFNEVQRIKNTILKINDKKKWLVLIDELFKGTNVQDAMKCSATVIRGLIRMSNSVFIMSTHLYEIGDELRQYPNISFKYFETAVKDDVLEFSYQLQDGISNDRLGYLILKREKVVEMLENL